MENNQTIYQNKEIIEIATVIAKKYNIPRRVILHIYRLYFEFITDTISKNNLLEGEIPDRFSFNLQNIGKIYTSPKIINKINQKRKERDEDFKLEESDTDV